jgi:molybdate transport system substrate-binding protein
VRFLLILAVVVGAINRSRAKGNAMMTSFKIAVTTASLLGAVTIATATGGVELTVVASTAMTEVLQALLPIFEHDSGHTVKVMFLSSADLPRKIKEGVPVDLVVTSPDTIDDLVKAGKVVAGSRVDLFRSGVGVAVRAGAPKPDVSTVEGFKHALVAAKSVGISKGPSGVYMMGLLERLGIADAIKAKAVFTEPGQRVGLVVANGRAEIGIQQITELLAIPGIDFVGPLPPSLQTTILYAMARPTTAKQPAAAKELVKFLSSKSVAPIAKKMGLDPAT